MILSQASHCALIVLSELTYNSDKRGVLISEISELNNVPQDIIASIIERLFEAEIIYYQESEGKKWMLLKCNSDQLSVYDVVMLFDRENFSGRFMDIQTEKLLQKSKLSYTINLELNHIMRYIFNQFKRFNLIEWGEMSECGHHLHYHQKFI